VRELIAGFEREAKGPTLDPDRRATIEAEIVAAKQAAGELIRRISEWKQVCLLAPVRRLRALPSERQRSVLTGARPPVEGKNHGRREIG